MGPLVVHRWLSQEPSKKEGCIYGVAVPYREVLALALWGGGSFQISY